MKKKKNAGKKLTRKELLLRIGLIALAVILVLAAAVFGVMNYVLDRIGSGETQPVETVPPHLEDFETDPPATDATGDATNPSDDATEPTGESADPDAIIWPEVEQLKSDAVINIMLIGQDARPGEKQTRADTMILVSINKKTNAIHMTSFMRDLYVQIPGGYSDNRLNAAYRFGGSELLNKTLQKNFGITIDGNVTVGFEQFPKVIDVLGGVDVSMSAQEAEYMTNSVGVGIFHEGMNHLNGEQALEFCRIRKIGSDFGRTERQRRVLTAVANSFKGAEFATLMGIVNDVLPYVHTNLSDGEIVSYATAAITAFVSGGSIQNGRVPQNGHFEYRTIRNMSILLPDLIKCNEYLKNTIYGG